jgi:hypothetical protein
MEEQKFPPVTEVAMLSLALIVAGGIYLSAHLPQRVPLALSAALMVFNLVSLTRVQAFAWERFFSVAKWSMLAYFVTAGLIEFVFIRNHTSGGPLVVLTLSLVVYAVHVPTLVGFTVARYYQPAPAAPAGEGASAARA